MTTPWGIEEWSTVLRHACPKCGAVADHFCVTANGKLCAEPHVDRQEAAGLPTLRSRRREERRRSTLRKGYRRLTRKQMREADSEWWSARRGGA